jgi:hypothetical protein
VRNVRTILYDAILTSYICMINFLTFCSLKHRGGSLIAVGDRIERIGDRRVVKCREERSRKTEQDRTT